MGTIMPSPRAGVRLKYNVYKIPDRTVCVSFFIFFFFLSATGLSCSTQDLPSPLWHPGSLVGACELLVVACDF